MRRAIGVDLGSRRVGVAVVDELGKLAHARPHLDGRDRGQLLRALCDLASAEAVDTFVLGLPRAMDGSEGIAARQVRHFAAQLRQRSGLRVQFIDERLSSAQAEQRLREQGLDGRAVRQRVDSAAAAILLQTWIDSTPAAVPASHGE